MAARHCVAALIVSSSSIAWKVGALQRVSAILLCLLSSQTMWNQKSASFSLIRSILVLSISCILSWKMPCRGLYMDLTSNFSMLFSWCLHAWQAYRTARVVSSAVLSKEDTNTWRVRIRLAYIDDKESMHSMHTYRMRTNKEGYALGRTQHLPQVHGRYMSIK